jgi:hypothetical protein
VRLLASSAAAKLPRSGTVSRSQTMTLCFMQIAAHYPLEVLRRDDPTMGFVHLCVQYLNDFA